MMFYWKRRLNPHLESLVVRVSGSLQLVVAREVLETISEKVIKRSQSSISINFPITAATVQVYSSSYFLMLAKVSLFYLLSMDFL